MGAGQGRPQAKRLLHRGAFRGRIFVITLCWFSYNAKIGGDFDAALYQECMENKGVVGKVIVLPIKPEPASSP